MNLDSFSHYAPVFNGIAYIAIVLWMLFWSVRVIRVWKLDAESIKSLLFLAFTWIGIIGAGVHYFMR